MQQADGVGAMVRCWLRLVGAGRQMIHQVIQEQEKGWHLSGGLESGRPLLVCVWDI